MTDAERRSEVRRRVFVERYGVEPGQKSAPTTTEAACRTEELDKINMEARRRLSAGRRLGSWPPAERAGAWPPGAETVATYLTGTGTGSAPSAVRSPGTRAGRRRRG